ncbi:hypothetical protein P879_11973 [Paragonimus westermani]|uniref:Uncharacterized protein n=1 Tax=Paragonimus westermani TaxID=34504 RepID=A0A8T0D5K2_9TREM|nr:hypothetical protein P879_11973 [Paragonimus westermani]
MISSGCCHFLTVLLSHDLCRSVLLGGRR